MAFRKANLITDKTTYGTVHHTNRNTEDDKPVVLSSI